MREEKKAYTLFSKFLSAHRFDIVKYEFSQSPKHKDIYDKIKNLTVEIFSDTSDAPFILTVYCINIAHYRVIQFENIIRRDYSAWCDYKQAFYTGPSRDSIGQIPKYSSGKMFRKGV